MTMLRNPALTVQYMQLRQRIDAPYWREIHAFDDAFMKYDRGWDRFNECLLCGKENADG